MQRRAFVLQAAADEVPEARDPVEERASGGVAG